MGEEAWIFVVVLLAAASIWFGSRWSEGTTRSNWRDLDRFHALLLLGLGIFLIGLVVAKGIYELVRR
jgi:hypothetical protein